jgi:hypothetical protein
MKIGPQIRGPDAVGSAGCGHGEVTGRAGHRAVAHGDQLGLQQEIGVVGGDVEALKGQAIGAGNSAIPRGR